MSKNPKNVHVLPNKANSNWQVKTEGASKAAGVFQTKAEAKSAGAIIAKNRAGELFIHNENGKIANRNSFGSDPFPPRDRVH